MIVRWLVYSLRYIHQYSSIVFIDRSLIDRSITTNIGWSSPKDKSITTNIGWLICSLLVDQSPLSSGRLMTTIIDTQRHRVIGSIWDSNISPIIDTQRHRVTMIIISQSIMFKWSLRTIKPYIKRPNRIKLVLLVFLVADLTVSLYPPSY